uniref:IS4 family transposase n=1 Tax=Paraburkholderia aspalathi TaxID=1324617 RepID=UPI001F3B77DD
HSTLASEDDIDDWASAEFSGANLGDARLVRRLVALARRLACSPQGSFPQSLKSAELKAAYRFFDNTRIDTDGVLAPHIEQTLDRMRQVPVVLAVQDTTEFNLSHLLATTGLGYGSGRHERGFLMHSLLAVTPEGLPLGVLGMKTWARPVEAFGKKHQRKARPITEKESIKWIEGIEHLGALKARCAETRLVGVGDRESDLYELFATERPDGVDWLIRAARNRCVRHPQEYLWETVQATAPLGNTDLLVPARGNMPQRTARLTLRCSAVRLRPPRARASRLTEIDVFAVHAIEDAPPDGVEPLEWMLLSSVPTTTLEEVLERLAWYARRWT